MTVPIVYMYSGQGSQYFHMGRQLYENNQRFAAWMDYCNEIVEPLIKDSLIDILYKKYDKAEIFDRIVYTNPALLCIQYCLSKLLMEMQFKPEVLVGYSIGEISAAVVSNAIPLEQGLRFSVDMAETMEAYSESAAMISIVDSPDLLDRYPRLFERCWVTAYNFGKNFVVTGYPKDIQSLQLDLDKIGVVNQKLPVNYGFHTPLIDSYKGLFDKIIQKIDFSDSRIRLYSSTKAGPLHNVDAAHVWNVLRYPVDFNNTVLRLLRENDYLFIDVGPSGTLATFLKYLILPGSGSTYVETINQYGKDLDSMARLSDKVARCASV